MTRPSFATSRALIGLLLLSVFMYDQFSRRNDVFLASLINDSSRKTTSTSVIENTRNSPLRFEMVVTLLHHSANNWKQGPSDDGKFLLLPEVQDIPVTICSPDELISQTVYQTGLEAKYFRPEENGIFDHLVNSNRSGSVKFLPIVNGERGQEVPGYLHYILHNYDALPDVVIFVHSNPLGHGQNVLRSIRHVVDNWTPEQIGFLHLNENSMCRPGGGNGAWGKFWEVLGFNLSHIPRFIKQPCCAQFMVTRDRILLRPKWFYQQLLKLTYTLRESAFQEHYWHIFFGESAIMSDDREIYRYLLSNWTKPVRNAVLHNPYPNVPYSESMKPWYDKAIGDPDAYYPKMSSNRNEVCPPSAISR